eukprot:CAMPEP_0172006052 /NCGR_PEP_ID=MMETSP1041-20130122/5365_1 /TAXON_ID=464988 /ORGANISM="Hemiselmis andersenii, Strain CCMP439" /LENGTH=42 /DNA_ID= /DNA_START= /DNA_END= /DNA_ORIENTATION=
MTVNCSPAAAVLASPAPYIILGTAIVSKLAPPTAPATPLPQT